MSLVTRLLPNLQRLSEGEMPDTVTIHRPGVASANEYGAMVPGANTDTATVGRFSALDSTAQQYLEQVISGELAQDVVGQVTMPLDTSVELEDSLTVEVERTGATYDFGVIGVVPVTSFAVHRKVLVRML